jgi:drug/metabolite transporter (DMT)-like permease
VAHTRTTLGLLGTLGIWLTAGLAVPFVNVLHTFTPEQLMVFRGFLTMLMALTFLRKVPWQVDGWTYAIAAATPFATLGLFEGTRAWGAGPTIIILTATPLVNFLFSLFLGRRISRASAIGLVLVLGGVVLARWGGHFQWTGFGWSMLATIANALLYECFDRAKADSLQKCFWGMLGMGTLGLVVSLYNHSSWAAATNPKLLLLLLGFAFIGGFLYWKAYMVAFENLPMTEASVLAQGETPAVILGAYFLLGEPLTLIQWMGVIISLYGAWYLSRWLKKRDG